MQRLCSILFVLLYIFITSNASTNRTLCPRLMVMAVPGVCIDQFEWPNIPGQKPLLGLSGLPTEYDRDEIWDLETLCISVGKRVCMAHEWITACEGPQKTKYPFGDKLPKYILGAKNGICNYDKFYIGVDERLVFKRDPQHMKYLDQSEPSGSRKRCRSWSGAYDMIGNAEEWVKCDHGREGWCLASRFWAEPRSCHSLIPSHSPRWHYYTVGGRCCLDLPKQKN